MLKKQKQEQKICRRILRVSFRRLFLLRVSLRRLFLLCVSFRQFLLCAIVFAYSFSNRVSLRMPRRYTPSLLSKIQKSIALALKFSLLIMPENQCVRMGPLPLQLSHRSSILKRLGFCFQCISYVRNKTSSSGHRSNLSRT